MVLFFVYFIAGDVAESGAFDSRIKLKPSIFTLVGGYPAHSDWTMIRMLKHFNLNCSYEEL